jgi:glycerol-3-phosphate acyltransferase PlsX
LKNITIAVDAMGGDYGPSVVVPAALQVLSKKQELHLILVGDQDILKKMLQSHQNSSTLRDGAKSAPPQGEREMQSRITIHHTTQKVEMDEAPSLALRSKKDSSMRVAINLVKEGKADACVSAGNTGALMATARFVLKTIPGIDRPAIISTFPTKNEKKMRMLDLGANVDSSAENLFQFAVMGSVLASAIDNIQNPRISLLNIGEEDIKGNEQVKETAQLLSNSPLLNYVGFIEADQLFDGKTDLIVCDGFVGNVALKSSEGVATYILTLLKEGFSKNIFTKITGLLARPILRSLFKRIDPAQYNGATFIGLQGIVIKSHGGAKIPAFINALEEAILEVEKNIPEKISTEVEHILKSHPLNTPNSEGGAQ